MNEQNPKNPDNEDTEKFEQSKRRINKAFYGLLCASLVPAAYLGYMGAIALAEAWGVDGRIVSVFLFGITCIIIIALALFLEFIMKHVTVGKVPLGASLVGLTVLSLWMLTALQEAREGLMAFGLVSIVLIIFFGLAKLLG